MILVVALVAVTVLVVLVAGYLLARRRFMMVRVVGSSMEPTFATGELVVARRMPGAGPVGLGDVVVVDSDAVLSDSADRDGLPAHLVKRVVATAGEIVPGQPDRVVPPDHVWIEGDGASTMDSRHFGPVPTVSVAGLIRNAPRA